MTKKKHEIKVSIAQSLFQSLTDQAKKHQLSFLEYASRLVVEAAHDHRSIRSIAPWFRRAYKVKGDAWLGHVIAESYEDLLPTEKASVRRSIKLPESDYIQICGVAYALGCPHATAATILLFAAFLQNVDIKDTEDARTATAG